MHTIHFPTAPRFALALAVVLTTGLGAGGPAHGSDPVDSSAKSGPGLSAYFAPKPYVLEPEEMGVVPAAHRIIDHSVVEHGVVEHGVVEHGFAEHGIADHAAGMWLESGDRFTEEACQCGECAGYRWEFLPKDALYPFYLADTKASRLAGQWLESTGDHTLLDSTLGGRFGIFRYVDATPGPFKRGIQADVEGSAQVRLDMDFEHDVRSVDFRAGVPIAVSFGRFQTRFGYYHLSSHVGDEFLIRYPTFDRENYSRDVLFLGAAYWLSTETRVYGEAGWAFYSDVCEPWEFVTGIESAPRTPTGLRGAPFYAINGHLREEVDFGGSVTVQAGWAWRSSHNTGLLRTGLHYFNGKSNQFSFYDQHEELIGAGLWYDF